MIGEQMKKEKENNNIKHLINLCKKQLRNLLDGKPYSHC